MFAMSTNRRSVPVLVWAALVLGCVLGAVLPTSTACAMGYVPRSIPRARSNSQLPVGFNTMLADLNSDLSPDVVQTSDNRLFATELTTPSYGNGIGHVYAGSRIVKVFSGWFDNLAEEFCVLLETGAVSCHVYSTSTNRFEPTFTTGNIIGANEVILVGDFDGNKYDDVLVYTAETGATRLLSYYSFGGEVGFATNANVTPPTLPLMAQVRQANLDGDAKADLVVHAAGQVQMWSAGQWILTAPLSVAITQDFLVGSVDGDGLDDILLHNRSTGQNTFYTRSGSALVPLSGIAFPVTPGASAIRFTRGMARAYAQNATSQNRDDVIVVTSSAAIYEARESDYVLRATRELPSNNTWGNHSNITHRVVLCKFSDSSLEPATPAVIATTFANLDRNYFPEMTWGTRMLEPAVASAWVSTSVASTAVSPSGTDWDSKRIANNACLTASGMSDDGVSLYTFVWNAAPSTAMTMGRSSFIPPNLSGASIVYAGELIAHEVGHALATYTSRDGTPGLPHSFSYPTTGASSVFDYGDPTDVMGLGGASGSSDSPRGMNALYRQALAGVASIPSSRIVSVATNTAAQALAFAPLNNPETMGLLFAKVANAPYDPNVNYIVLEYRTKVGFDSGISDNGIYLHRRTPAGFWGLTAAQTYQFGWATTAIVDAWDPVYLPYVSGGILDFIGAPTAAVSGLRVSSSSSFTTAKAPMAITVTTAGQ